MADETETVALSVPQDITAEQAVLGSILLSTDPQDLIADLMTILEPSDFYRTAHRLIYAAILKLDESQRAIDILTIVDELTIKSRTLVEWPIWRNWPRRCRLLVMHCTTPELSVRSQFVAI